MQSLIKLLKEEYSLDNEILRNRVQQMRGLHSLIMQKGMPRKENTKKLHNTEALNLKKHVNLSTRTAVSNGLSYIQFLGAGSRMLRSVFFIVLWCNWQHVWFWSRRVEVRTLVGQRKKQVTQFPYLNGDGFYKSHIYL